MEPEPGLAERTYRTLRDEILSQGILPGTRLSVPEVARRLNVSRSPAREAIAKITYEGLASATPNRGAVVVSLGPDDLVEI